MLGKIVLTILVCLFLIVGSVGAIGCGGESVPTSLSPTPETDGGDTASVPESPTPAPETEEDNTVSWTLIGGDGIGWADATYEYVVCLTTYNGKLYVGLGDGTGDSEVWEYDGSP